MIKENIKIYLAWGPSGEYDTYNEECLGAFLKRENAEKAGKEWYDKKTNAHNDLPMTLEEFQELNFGYAYADDDYEEEGERSRGGYTKEDFERMDEAWDNQYETFYDPIITEVEIMDFHELKDLINNDKENI